MREITVEKFELTGPQKLIYETDVFLGEGAATIAADMMYVGELDIDSMTNALNWVIKTNDALRLQIVDDGTVSQILLKYYERNFDVKQFNTLENYREYAQNEGKKRINPNGLLVRFNIIITPVQKGVLICLSHLIGDACSMGILIPQIHYAYQEYVKGKEPHTNTPSYLSYIEKDQKYRASEKYIQDRDYWIKQYKNHDTITY